MEYGESHEGEALKSLENALGLKIRPCGLFIHPKLQYLAATPDGLVDDGIVEVKCPASCQDITPNQAISLKKFLFWKIDRFGQIHVNTNHDYFYQVQGQLQATEKEYCFFVMWTKKGCKMEKIFRDNDFWRDKMLKKLEPFYFSCLLPELTDPRYPRSMPIRNPASILEAQEIKKKGKTL
ncbi:yqaJ domain-containing protein [Trichonephila clavata]|uniref:YqaJ domain-containing protein n=1 Tax=Trichonephila clavata TaxID=2740835 RepID=A0A8X6HWT4_TRICU|nr:yqaJ domain-containing protein [Trichonephila clavata]